MCRLSTDWLPAVAIALAMLAPNVPASGAESDSRMRQGTIQFTTTPTEAAVPERFRLAAGSFDWAARRMETVTENVEVWDLTFPSPVVTPVAPNNTVHAEYYRARRAGRRPGVVVLHIMGGDFALSRLFANALAQHGACALFVKMPYYGPRRDPASPRRMVSPDPRETVEGLTQAVLDIRRATAWLAEQPEIDPQRLGIFGISLGGITSALALTAEPKLTSACLMLAGGDIGQVGWDAPEARAARERWLALGGTRESFVETLQAVDPVTNAAAARGKRILMLNALYDEVIPRACTESLWRALGQPEIRWYPGGHYSVIRFIFGALLRVGRFFGEGATGAQQ